MKRYCLLLALLPLATVWAQPSRPPAFITDSLDRYINRGLKEWKIPGVAVCIVRDGKVALVKGYGVREAGGPEKVNEHTLFMIGSNTKAFTGTALAMLEAKGRFSLDDKVQKWLPEFKLYDPWVAKEATVRDLLCHRLGFETFQGDFMYFDSDLTSAEVLQKFGRVKPMYGFRSRWGYTNAAFLAAGEVLQKATGRTWAEFMRDSLFRPLGMNATLALSTEMPKASNRAAAHTVVSGTLRKIPYGELDNIAPAGSISSSANDMSHWLLMQLSGGKYNGRQAVSEEALEETWKPASIAGEGGVPFNTGHYSLYGLGWFLQEYAGREIVSHTGGVNGFVTSVTLVPEENLGIVVLTNTDANGFYEALKWEILDAYLKLPYRNYHQLSFTGYMQEEQASARRLKLRRDTIASRPATPLPLENFAGQYTHEIYGNMNLSHNDGRLVATFQHHKGLSASLEPLGGNRFLATFSDPLYGIRVWPFTIENGKVRSVSMAVADFVEFTRYEFVKTN